jgi:hypothetical protein
MLNEQDFAVWVKRTSLSDPARSVVAHIRTSQPARRVGGGRGNVVGRYPSRKMGVTIQFESHRVELPAILELEHNDDVLEYYDQPPSIKLDYSSADGKHLGVLHTPDSDNTKSLMRVRCRNCYLFNLKKSSSTFSMDTNLRTGFRMYGF